jgi:hypothetical protein
MRSGHEIEEVEFVGQDRDFSLECSHVVLAK